MIDRIKEKPFLLLLLFAILFFAFSLIPTDETIDFQLHDSYTVIAQSYIFIAVGLVLLFIVALYFMVSKFLVSIKLTWLHVLLTSFFISFIFYITPTFRFFQPQTPRRYYSYYEFETSLYNLIYYSALILFLSQFIFLINIIAGILKKSYPSK
jgi:heme/copper-type cytochrome/quinol oxidase subunit 1